MGLLLSGTILERINEVTETVLNFKISKHIDAIQSILEMKIINS